MEKCVQCRKTENEVKLFDGIYVNDIVKICERCSLLANIPIIKRPSAFQLKSSERGAGVRERLSKMAGLDVGEKKEKSRLEALKELEMAPELEKPEDLVYKLVDNFHWIIQTERRRKGFSIKQLADSIGESEEAIKLLEKRIVPSKALDLIRALEQFLKVRLVKKDFIELMEEKRKENERIEFELQRRRQVIEKPKEFILENPEKNPLGIRQTSSFGSSVKKNISEEDKPISLRNREAEDFRIRDLQRMQEKIDKDMAFEKKTSFEVGQEQMDNFGKEDTEHLKRTVYRDVKSSGGTSRIGTPSIYDLMKRKEEKDRTNIAGSDIKIVEEKSEKKDISKEKWDELE